MRRAAETAALSFDAPTAGPCPDAPPPPRALVRLLLIEGRQLAVEDLLGQPQRLRPHRIDGASEVRVRRRRAGAKGLGWAVAVRIDHEVPPPARPGHRQQNALVGAERAHELHVLPRRDQLLVTEGVILHPRGLPQRNEEVIHGDVVLRVPRRRYAGGRHRGAISLPPPSSLLRWTRPSAPPWSVSSAIARTRSGNASPAWPRRPSAGAGLASARGSAMGPPKPSAG